MNALRMFIFKCCIKWLEFIFLIYDTLTCRSLRNARTKIHKHLFVAMLAQVIIRLTLYVDQAILRNGRDLPNENMPAIQNTVNICNFISRYTLCVCTVNVANECNFPWNIVRNVQCAFLFFISFGHSRICARALMCFWNTAEPQCLCGCLSKDCICIMWSQWLCSKAVFRIHSIRVSVGGCRQSWHSFGLHSPLNTKKDWSKYIARSMPIKY